ncbi:glycosyltransferase [Patescibacteria group bacterium]|nr:glycosyltransferase [Patescibacteria group bacterium]MBU1612964.1 glycosyltransferase [Patescibacteria group bacterium]
MRTIHIAPSAFEYFNDIKSVVFELVDGLTGLGQEAEVVTLQYTMPTKQERVEVREKAPATHYSGTVNFSETIKHLHEFDIVHLHCPFLGAAGEILRWKKDNPNVPFLITYYRDIPFIDLISIYLRWYNNWYLPKLFSVADKVLCVSIDNFMDGKGRKYLKDVDKLEEFGMEGAVVYLTESANEVKLVDRDGAVKNLAKIYNTLIT